MAATGQTVIFGGSFNPPHVGHQMACLYLLEALGADRVWVVPSSAHPFGKPLEPFEQRVQMCRLMARPFAARVEVKLTEERLAESDGRGLTYDLLSHLCAAHPEASFALAVGADILHETHKWHRWSDIEAMVPIVVIGRMGYTFAEAPLALPDVSSTDLRRRLAAGEPTEGLMPTAVSEYIEAHGLYRIGAGSRPE